MYGGAADVGRFLAEHGSGNEKQSARQDAFSGRDQLGEHTSEVKLMLPRRPLISRCRGLPSVGVAEPILQKSQLKRQHQASERVSVEQLEAHAACNLSGM
jgi:hypothetical protein